MTYHGKEVYENACMPITMPWNLRENRLAVLTKRPDDNTTILDDIKDCEEREYVIYDISRDCIYAHPDIAKKLRARNQQEGDTAICKKCGREFTIGNVETSGCCFDCVNIKK